MFLQILSPFFKEGTSMIWKKQKSIGMVLCLWLLFFGKLSHAETLNITGTSFFSSQKLGKIELFYDEKGFHVLQNGKLHDVRNYWIDPLLRNIKHEQLKAFLDKGYICVTQLNNKEFSLKAKIRILGGGPITSGILYWATKTLCYGTFAAGAGTAVVLTGGAAAGAVTGGVVAAATTSAGIGAGAVAGGITAAGLAGEAAMVSTSIAASAGGVVGAIAAVETASAAAAAFGMALPLP